MASMELLAIGGQSGRTDVPTLGQTPIKAEDISRKHHSDSCDLSVSVSAIHAPSVPLRCCLGLPLSTQGVEVAALQEVLEADWVYKQEARTSGCRYHHNSTSVGEESRVGLCVDRPGLR